MPAGVIFMPADFFVLCYAPAAAVFSFYATQLFFMPAANLPATPKILISMRTGPAHLEKLINEKKAQEELNEKRGPECDDPQATKDYKLHSKVGFSQTKCKSCQEVSIALKWQCMCGIS